MVPEYWNDLHPILKRAARPNVVMRMSKIEYAPQEAPTTLLKFSKMVSRSPRLSRAFLEAYPDFIRVSNIPKYVSIWRHLRADIAKQQQRWNDLLGDKNLTAGITETNIRDLLKALESSPKV